MNIAEETEEKASGIANTTGEMMDEIKNAVSEVAPESDENTDAKSEKKMKRTATKDAKDK